MGNNFKGRNNFVKKIAMNLFGWPFMAFIIHKILVGRKKKWKHFIEKV